jgi:cobalt-zinc-cadmium efflux system protein
MSSPEFSHEENHRPPLADGKAALPHCHQHNHAPRDFGRAFAIGVTLNIAFVVFEAALGVLAHSLALISDAGHNLGDVLGLLLAWGASALAKSIPTSRRTFGLRSTTILAALFNSLLLLAVTGGVSWEAIKRISVPQAVEGNTMTWVALLVVLVNAGTAWLFFSGQKHDLNIRGAFLHLASDALVSVGVVFTGIAIVHTHWLWLDPVVSLLIGLAIVASTWGLLRESLNLLLHAVPEGVDPAKVRAFLWGLPAVQSVHDLHIWAMSTSEVALTAHLIRSDEKVDNAFLAHASEELREHFGIGHATLQIEADGGHPCDLEPDEVV